MIYHLLLGNYEQIEIYSKFIKYQVCFSVQDQLLPNVNLVNELHQIT